MITQETGTHTNTKERMPCCQVAPLVAIGLLSQSGLITNDAMCNELDLGQ